MSPKKKSSQMGPAAEPAIETGDASSLYPVTVAIGASAGGLEALQQLFAGMPADTGLSFIVLVHHSPDGPSLLPEILRRFSSMEVVAAEVGTTLRPNAIFVMPPAGGLILSSVEFRPNEAAEKRRVHYPIDLLFSTLAAEAGRKAIAVILSGTGSDGTEGAKGVKDAGGIVMVQEPASAKYADMPMSGIDAGVVDFVLPSALMGGKIGEIAGRLPSVAPLTNLDGTFRDELSPIFALIKAETGNDFSSYKTNTILRRIERRMAVVGAAGLDGYSTFLGENVREVQILAKEILIGVTSFFRDPEAFDLLRRQVIPCLFAGHDPDTPVRIWHACSATGEEVYSTAILIQEYLIEHNLTAKLQIFATDIDETALQKAREGIYPEGIGAAVEENRLKRYFTKKGGGWQVKQQLRDLIVFSRHNLLSDPPFSRLDLLVCRNFLIYLNQDIQKRLVPMFHQMLKPGGFLFLGTAETVGIHGDLFAPVDKKWKIFSRREGGIRRADTLLPFAASGRRFAGIMPALHPPDAQEPGPAALAEKHLLERYLPAHVVVNEAHEVVYVSKRTGAYMELPAGELTRNLLKMTREELRPALRSAVYKAFAEKKEIVYHNTKMSARDGDTAVNIIVTPLKTPSAAGKLALVIFEPEHSPPTVVVTKPEAGATSDEQSREQFILRLEDQLRATHEQLEAANEQFETSNEEFMSTNEELVTVNEELQSTNEELQATNEELETAKEELQSTNEELMTVNDELHSKVAELNQTTSDMENLITSSEVATIFLDRELNIKRLSPAVTGIFDIIHSDIGRPFRRLAEQFGWHTFSDDAAAVLAARSVAEREVTSSGGDRFLLRRVLPYRTANMIIDGVVVTFIDITERKLAEEALREIEARFQLLVEGVSDYAIFLLDREGRITSWNSGAERIKGYNQDEILGRHFSCLYPPEAVAGGLPEQALLIAERDGRFEDEGWRVRKDGTRFWANVVISAIRDKHDRIAGFSKITRDLTERKQVEEELRRAKEAAEEGTRTKSQFLANMSHELRTPMSGVLGMLDIVLAGNLEAPQREYLETAHSSARSLVRILNDVLDLTKIEMGKLSIEVKPFSVRDCVEDSCNILLPLIKSKGLDLECAVAGDVPETLLGDRNRINQVLTNLVGNAVKFTETGKVEIRVTTGDRSPSGRRYVTFSIADTGIGIPDDKRNLLFKVFSQVDDSHSRSFGGTGLGLAISKEIVGRMGGTISFTSEVGKGSSFTFTLPLEEAETKSAVTRAQRENTKPLSVPSDAGQRKPRLLIAEDDQVNRQILRLMLRAADFEVDLAENGLKTVEMWEEGTYDLILMDVQMPFLNGFDATSAIREKERTRGGHVPIVAITAHAFKEDEESCLDAGMDAYVSKPIDFKICLQVIEETLNK